MTKTTKLKVKALFAAACFIVMLLLPFAPLVGVAYTAAATASVDYDDTNIFDDLNGATIDGKAFNVADYPADSDGKLKILALTEYCYAYDEAKADNYGLYIYVYNPKRTAISAESAQNKVNFATEYKADGEGGFAPSMYGPLLLRYCGRSEGEYLGLFYKYRIIDEYGADGLSIKQRARKVGRRYDIATLYFLTIGARNASAYSVGVSYKYSGYAKGYGKDESADSTLKCESKTLQTVKLDVESTYFRPDVVSSLGKGHQNTLNAVYFRIPDELLREYGTLQRVLAEWYEYRTSPIVITDNDEVYNDVKNGIGVEVLEFGHIKDVGAIFSPYRINEFPPHTVSWSWNLSPMDIGFLPIIKQSRLSYLFSSKGTPLNQYVVSGEELKQYIYGYTDGSVKIDIDGRKFSSSLFSEEALHFEPGEHPNDGRTNGYKKMDVDVDKSYDMLAYDTTHQSWWDKFVDYGFNAPDTGTSFNGIKPIVMINGDDVAMSDSEFAAKYYINSGDVASVKDYVREGRDETTWITRFAVTDYFASEAIWRSVETSIIDQSKKVTVAQTTVFLNFNIIQLTLSKDNKETIIPVVANPIDIATDITSPLDGSGYPLWLIAMWIVLGVLAGIPAVYGVYLTIWAVLTLLQAALTLPAKAARSISAEAKRADGGKSERKKRR